MFAVGIIIEQNGWECGKIEKLFEKVLTIHTQCGIIYRAIERTQGLLVLLPVWRNRQTPGT